MAPPFRVAGVSLPLILYDVRTQRIIPRRDGKLAGGG